MLIFLITWVRTLSKNQDLQSTVNLLSKYGIHCTRYVHFYHFRLNLYPKNRSTGAVHPVIRKFSTYFILFIQYTKFTFSSPVILFIVAQQYCGPERNFILHFVIVNIVKIIVNQLQKIVSKDWIKSVACHYTGLDSCLT